MSSTSARPKRTQGGCLEGLEALLEHFRPSAMRTALQITGSATLAEDAVQEAFMRAYRDFAALREADALAGWLRRIVIHSAIDQMRRERPEVPLGLAGELTEDWNRKPASPDPLEAVLETEQNQVLIESLGRIDPAARVILVLRFYAGLVESEISLLTGFPKGTIKSKISRALAKLNESQAVATDRRAPGTKSPPATP